MIIGVIGGRDTDGREIYSNQEHVNQSFDSVLAMVPAFELPELTLVSGGSKGAETMAIKWADEHGIKHQVVPPRIRMFQNEEDGVNKAFHDRNNRIIAVSDKLVFFWNGSVPIILDAIMICVNFKKPSIIFPIL